MYGQHQEIQEYAGMMQEVEWHHGDPHAKRQLRIDAWRDLNENAFHASVTDRLWLKSVLYKMKRDEIAKPGKYPRMIGDLGVAASLQGFRVTEVMKHAMAELPIDYKNGRLEFVISPKEETMTTTFKKLLNHPGYYFAYFSDDSCISIRTERGAVIYNLDISSCDASHWSTFMALLNITPSHLKHDMLMLIEQCMLPIHVRSNNGRAHVTLDPTHPRLYSGSTITTLINNLANIMICKSIIDSQAFTPDEIALAAAKVGYIVSVDVCRKPEDIQFLKHSPAFDLDNQLRPVLNVGVMIRSLGQCKGDLPGRGPLEPRARKFTHAYLQGMYPTTHFPLLERLRAQSEEGGEEYARAVKRQFTTYEHGTHHYYTNESVMKRYDLTLQDFGDLELLGQTGIAQTVSADVFGKILRKDYGLDME